MSFCAWRNPEGVASPLADRKPIANPSQPLQGWDENKHAPFSQGFKANPGLELANAFSVTLATRRKQTCTLFPGFQSKPWAGISQRFQRYACHPTKTNMHPFPRVSKQTLGWNYP